MHFLALSLLSILAGALLLAKTRKDSLDKFFSFLSWFFIVVGFVLFLGFIAGGICKMSNCCEKEGTECRQEMMMKSHAPMMQKGACCPGEKSKGTCEMKPDCMKNCPMHMQGDSAKMPCPMHMQGDTAKMPCPMHMKGDSVK